jgi:hypothetical protein
MKSKIWIVLPSMLLAGWLLSSVARAQEEAEQPREKPAAAPEEEGDRDAQVRELQERIGQVEREIAELREKGNREGVREREPLLRDLRGKLAALRGAREARRDEGRGAGEPPAEVRERLENLKREIQELRSAGKNEEAGRLEQEARSILQRLAGGPQIPPEARERLENMKREIQELRSAGRVEEAERLEREVHQLMQRFAGAGPQLPPEVRERLNNLRQEIAKLREAGENDKAAELEREARGIMAQFGGGPSEGMRRLQHLRIAAENLQAAGMPELARQVMERIEDLQRELGAQEGPQGELRERRRDREPGAREGEGALRERRERRKEEREEPKAEEDRPKDADAPEPKVDRP